ncbi:hypothetical protein [Pectobacterium actinidiae]|uniref:hypothetical protein n=1 Tax=Pectobacterium actinidiae TaxID=1507808 RepID=UPI00380A2218
MPACYAIAQVFSSSEGCLVRIQPLDAVASHTGKLWLWVTDKGVTTVHGSDDSPLTMAAGPGARPGFDENRAELIWFDGVARTLTPEPEVCLTRLQLSLIHNHLN